MKNIISLHEQEYGKEPEVMVSVPGSVNLLGDHTGTDDGYVLSVALDKYLSVALSARDDNSLRFFSADFDERKRTTVPNLKYRKEDRWANYPKGVLHELIQLGFSVRGCDMTIASGIPVGVGLGSSAALGVASAVAYSELYELDLSEFQIVQSAAMAESSFIERETSLSDHMTTTVSGNHQAIFLNLKTLDYERIQFPLNGYRLLLTESSVPQVNVDPELEERRKKSQSCLSLLKSRREGSSFEDFSPADLRWVPGIITEDVRRKCLHVLEENGRVQEGREYLMKGELALLGKLMNRSHESLRDNYEVSCPEIDWLVKRAWEIDGVLGSRLTGSGFGGCTVTLIKADSVSSYLERFEEYERIFGFAPKAYEIRPLGGVEITDSAVISARA